MKKFRLRIKKQLRFRKKLGLSFLLIGISNPNRKSKKKWGNLL